MPSKTELIERAYGAWFKYRRGSSAPPTLSASEVREYDGLTYVVLKRGDQVVDVYRYREQDGALLRLRAYYPWGRQVTRRRAVA